MSNGGLDAANSIACDQIDQIGDDGIDVDYFLL